MAKKNEGGSNLGLIITLVFFVLATIILGVTTYMGFSAQDEKDKAVAKANTEKVQAEKDAKWGRSRAQILRAIIGGEKAPGTDEAAVQLDMQQIASATYQNAAPDAVGEFAKYVKDGVPAVWDASKSTTPSKSLVQVIRERDQRISAEKERASTEAKSAAEQKRQREEAEAELAKSKETFKTELEKNKATALADRKTDTDELASQRDKLRTDNEEYQKLRDRLDKAEKRLASLETESKKDKALLASTKRDLRTTSDDRDTKEAQLNRALAELGKSVEKIDEEVKDARYAKMLREWKRDWKITEIDRRGSQVYINLGFADKLTPQVTFSIHGVGADGQMNPQSKGTIEVVKILGSGQAIARVTSERDSRNFKKDPIVRGDKLFNPTWDPNMRRHVAIAGLTDLGGEGSDNSEDLRKLLRRQGVEIDAYIDVKDQKGPKIVGPGVSQKTDYLILADGLEAVNHPKARDKAYEDAFRKLDKDMRAKANENGVTVITLRRYLDMIGYVPPRAVRSASGR